MKLSLFLVSILLSWTSLQSVHAYNSPDYEQVERVFQSDPDRDVLRTTDMGRALLEIAMNVKGDPDYLKERAIALAWSVASLEEQNNVVTADFYFRLNRTPGNNPVIDVDPTSEGLVEAIRKTNLILSSAELSGSSTGLVTMIRELIQDLNSRNGKQVQLDFMEPGNGETRMLWAKIVPNPTGQHNDPRTINGIVKTAATSEEGTGMNDAEMIAGGGTFAGTQASLNGLLVMTLPGSEFAGDASRMNATAVGTDRSTEPTTIRFSQSVGPMMSGALSEVERFLSVKHDGIPRAHQVTLSFDERSTMKDGPSAAVACALLLDSLITGIPLDNDFAVTGDMNADGRVQSVGGIDGKVRGATRAGCSHVALPLDNMKAVSDIFLLEGPAEICKIQIFSITDFNQAQVLALAPGNRSTELAESLRLFSEIASVVQRPGGARMVTNPHVVERLRKVLELTPNHFSAELLLRSALGSAPKSLSLAGSFTALDRCLKPMNAVRESRDFASKIEPLKDSIMNLRRMRTLLDPRTKDVSDSIEDLYEALASIEPGMQASGPRFKLAIEEINQASDRLDAAYAKLRSDPEVQEELNM